MSKAWSFYEEEEGVTEVVFADTRGKARMYLKELDTFDNYQYIEIRPGREKSLDYLDHEDGYVMDWYKEEDRIAMVKNIGFYCLYPEIIEGGILDAQSYKLEVIRYEIFARNSSIKRFTRSGLSVLELCPAPSIHVKGIFVLRCHALLYRIHEPA